MNDLWTFGNDIFTDGLLLFSIRSVITVIFCFLFAKLIKRLCMQAIDRTSKRNSIPLMYVYKIVRFVIYTLGVMEIASRIIPLSGLGAGILGATSVMTVIIGLAAQATFGNFISGVVIAVYQPFHVDDYIFLPERNVAGTVELITFRHTVIRTNENTRITVPNSVMDAAVVEDKAYGQEYYRRWDSLTVAFDTDPDLLKKIITEEINKVKELVDTRSEEEKKNGDEKTPVRFNSFSDHGIEVSFPMATATYSAYFAASSKARENIIKALQRNRIRIVTAAVELHENAG